MPTEPAPIRPRLSTFDTAMVVFSLVVGIGIFRTPALVARAAGTPSRFYAAWILAGLLSLIGALTFAEIGSRHAKAGGYYRVVADCYSPTLAFMLNWAQVLMQGAGAAGVALIGAEYLAPLVLPGPWRTPTGTLGLALGTLLTLLLLNHLGIRTGARTQNLLSLLKVGLMLGLGLLAFTVPPAPPATAEAPAPLGPSLAAALVPCFYAYGGYHMTMNLGADVRDARRSFPRAITLGMALVVGLYLLLNLAYQRVLGQAGVAGSPLVAASLARAVLGPRGEALVSVAIFLSAAGFVNATILQMPRSYYAMAEDGVLPRAFLRVDPATQVQTAGLWAFGATLLLPALALRSFEKLLSYVIFTDALTLLVVASTLVVLRRRGEGGPGYRMPGYPWLPGIFLLALLGVALHVLLTEPRLAAMGLLLMATGLPLFRLGRALGRRDSGGTHFP